jgi:hypothetical protein
MEGLAASDDAAKKAMNKDEKGNLVMTPRTTSEMLTGR